MILRKMHLFIFFIALCSKIFSSLELSCPHGCCTQNDDPNLIQIGKQVTRCLEKIGFGEEVDCGVFISKESDPDPQIDAECYSKVGYSFGTIYYLPTSR